MSTALLMKMPAEAITLILQCQSLGNSNSIFCAKDDGELHEFKTFD